MNDLDVHIQAYATNVILMQKAAFEKEIDGVLSSKDIEYIHRMRVATRRLNNAFNLFENQFPQHLISKWRLSFKKVRQSLGETRDIDVQIEYLFQMLSNQSDPVYHPGIKRIMLRHKQKRSRLQAHVNRAIEELVTNNTLGTIEAVCQQFVPLDEFPAFASTVYQLADEQICNSLKEIQKLEPAIYDPANETELHLFRIVIKHFRYTLETYSRLYPDELKAYIKTCRELQDDLGNLHDCDVWISYLPLFLEEEIKKILSFYGNRRGIRAITPGIIYLQDSRKLDRNKAYKSFLDKWNTIQRKGLWNRLTSHISQYTIHQKIYPPQNQS